MLEEDGILFREMHHEAVFTIEEAERISIEDFDMSRVPKNLFLRDDKKRCYYLVSVRNDRHVDLKALRHIIGSRPLSFASEDDLHSILGLGRGEVTPFGLLNDTEHRAAYILDSFFSDGIIGIHPNDNTETVFIPAAELLSIMKENGTESSVIDF